MIAICLKQTKKVTRYYKRKTAVVTFGICRWEQIRVKWGGEKCKPSKLSNLNHQKYKLLLKGDNKKIVWMVRKQKNYLQIF